MCADFLAGVREARPTAAEDILATHRLCEDIVRHAEASER
jgi:virulence factor